MHFTGQQRDPETNLSYFPARYYSSQFGRFMSPDPTGIFLGNLNDPQSLNLYAYVRNNPASLTDPSGLGPDDCDPEDPSCGGCDPIFGCGGGCDPFSCGGGGGGGAIGPQPPIYTPPQVGASPYPNGTLASDDPFGGETNGIPNGLQIPSLGPGTLGCSYGSGSCGGGIYGFTYGGMTFKSFTDFLNWLHQVSVFLSYLKTRPVFLSINGIGAVQFTYQASTKTLCANLGLGASVPPTKFATAGVYNGGSMNNWKGVLSGWGYSLGGNIGGGYQASTNSAGTIGGPSVSPGAGVSASYTWGKYGRAPW